MLIIYYETQLMSCARGTRQASSKDDKCIVEMNQQKCFPLFIPGTCQVVIQSSFQKIKNKRKILPGYLSCPLTARFECDLIHCEDYVSKSNICNREELKCIKICNCHNDFIFSCSLNLLNGCWSVVVHVVVVFYAQQQCCIKAGSQYDTRDMHRVAKCRLMLSCVL